MHNNVQAYVSVHACLGYTLKDSPHCHQGIWGEEMRTLLCLCIGASECVLVCVCVCVCEGQRVGVTN